MAVFINEFHYDNVGTDTGEFIEIAATAGTDLTGWSIVLYNGAVPSAAVTYGSAIQLSGIVADQSGGFGFFSRSFPTDGLQNGGNDGFALVRPDGTVAQLLSYEGVFTASNGAAAGMTSIDVGVAETASTPVGASLSLVGTGSSYADFHWAVTADDTPGGANGGQTFTGGGTALPTLTINDVAQAEGNSGQTAFVFTVTRSSSAGASSVSYATADGSATVAGGDYVATQGTINFADGQSTAQVSVLVNGDTMVEGSETFSVNLTNATGATIADGQGIGTIQNDDVSTALTFIHDIQGPAFFSPILAADGIAAFNVRSTTLVTVQAVVTAIDDEGPAQGFFLAEEQSQWDANPFTSEGIFVQTRNDAGVGQTFADAAAGVTVGETVTVSAYVMEYQSFANQARTFLVNPTIVAQANDNVALPTLVLDGSAGKAIPNAILTSETPNYFQSTAGGTFTPQTDALDFLETVEGMRVSIPNMVVADGFVSLSGGEPFFKAYSTNFANPDQINSRGGYTIAGDPPLSPPDTPETDDNTRQGGRSINDGDTNPDVLELDFTGASIGGGASLVSRLSMGDQLGTVTGIIDFDFTDAKLFVTEPITIQNDTQPTQEVLSLADDSRSLRVATFNVENLDPTDGAARFTALANAVATNLKSPDILSIEEIQDNNGAAAGDGTSATGTDASLTWQMLTNAVNAATGKHYQWVDQLPTYNAEGGEQSGNIRVGFLYNTDRVQLGDLAPDASIAERRQFTDRIGDGVRDAGDRIAFSDAQIADQINAADYSATRKSLLGEFNFNGNTVYVVANHLPSKGGSGEPYQLDQSAGNPVNAGWEKRSAIADDVYRMLDTISSGNPGARIISGGDYNDFYFYRPLETVTGYVNPDGTARAGGARFANLTVTDLPEAERYSYVFGGNSQAIDHIVVDQTLDSVSSYDIVHINTGFNARGVDPALSDHDPAVAQFDLRSLAERLTGTAAADMLEGFGGADTLLGNAGNDSLTGGTGDDRLDGGGDTDTAFFTGVRADYTAQRDGTGGIIVADTVAGRDGADTLISVEQVSFGEGTVVASDQLLVGVTRTGTLGKDTLSGAANDDRLYGYAGNDQLNGFDGYDSLWGGQGNDTLLGGLGNDKLHGGAGDDGVQGGTGDDYLVGGLGNDRLEGGDGADIFFFAKSEGRDVITDYTVGQDAIHFASGVTIAGTAVGDYNGDGQSDLMMTLTGGGQVTVYGVTSSAQLTILYGQTAQITDVG